MTNKKRYSDRKADTFKSLENAVGKDGVESILRVEDLVPESVSNEKEIQCTEKQENELKTELRASEALFGFIAWLTTREEQVKLSSRDDCVRICDLLGEFCEINNLENPRDNYNKLYRLPKEKLDTEE